MWSAYRVYRAGPTSAVLTTAATTTIGGGLWRVANEEHSHESRPCPCKWVLISSRMREWPGRGQANLRVEVSAQPHQPYYYAMYAQTLAEQSQRSIGARVELKCLCVFDLSCPGRHPHASSTSYLAAGPQRLNGRSKRQVKGKRELPSSFIITTTHHCRHVLPVISMTPLPVRPMRPSLPPLLSAAAQSLAAIACAT